jgi:hypothetical protein
MPVAHAWQGAQGVLGGPGGLWVAACRSGAGTAEAGSLQPSPARTRRLTRPEYWRGHCFRPGVTTTAGWLEPLARAGFAAKGVVYLILGALLTRAAFGAGGRITDMRGALRAILREPYGRPLLGLLAAGLVGYALWRFLEAFADANRKGTKPTALAVRAGYAGSGIVYGSLAIYAARLALHAPGRGNRGGSVLDGWIDASVAEWLVPLAALGLIGYAIQQFASAWRGKLDSRVSAGEAARETGRWVITVSRFGIAARACVFVGIGMLLLTSRTKSASAATHTDTIDSLEWLSHLPNGEWVLAAVALGLGAYGIYQLVHARYRRIVAP